MSLNRVTLIGHVGKDPDVRYLDSGVAVAQFSLATTTGGYKTQEGQDIPERTEWHNLVAWRKLAQAVEERVRKGDKLYVEGELRTREYDGQDGIKRRITEVYINKMETFKPKGEGRQLPPDPGVPAERSTQNYAPNQPKSAPINAITGQQPVQQKVDFSNDGSDDLPF